MLRYSRKMKKLWYLRGIIAQSDQKCNNIYVIHQEFSSLHDGSPKVLQISSLSMDGAKKTKQRERKGAKSRVDDVCCILDNARWGPDLENALSAIDHKSQPEFVLDVLRRQKDVHLAIDYLRWVESQTGQAHSREAYNLLLMIMARSKNFDSLEPILEEMTLSGYGILPETCIELVTRFLKSKMMTEAVNLMHTLRKFKFRPAFSAYTTLIGALAEAHEPDLALTLFHQMQEMGYEVNVHLFTTLVRVFARKGRLDAALFAGGDEE